MTLKLGSTGSALRVGSTTAKYARVGTTLKAVAPPLDIAGSAAAAYSLRKLSYAYTGPVVEVRRSSDDTTADFTADEVEDGTLAAWVGAGNDGFVATWYDQSGNDRDATQATAGSQPQIVDNGSVVTEGGKPAIEFDGTGDELATASFATGLAASVFAVVKANSWHVTANYDSIFSHGYETGTTASKGIIVYLPSASFSDWVAGDIVAFGSGYTGGNAPRAIGQIQDGSDLRSVSVILGDSASTLHMNGGAVSLRSSSTGVISSITAPVLIGSSRVGVVSDMLSGKISELIYYQSDQTANRTAIEGNVAWHYGLQNKLPYNHAEVKPQTLPTDTDVLAFAAASGAVSIPDLLKIEDLVDYLKAESLWDYARFYPMKSSQNAGSGSTVYGLGGLTSNNMTLVNSPTWGSDGVTFNGSTQYGNIGDVHNGTPLHTFARVAFSSGAPSASEVIFGVYIASATNRSFEYYRKGDASGDPFVCTLSSSGLSGDIDSIETTDHTVSSDDECLSASFLSDGQIQMFQGKTQLATQRLSGSAQPSGPFDTGQDIYFAARHSLSGAVLHADFLAICPLWMSGVSLTTTQRETITDLINAL